MRINHFVLTATLLAACALPAAAFAQASPVGNWKTFDEETKQARSIVAVTQDANGTLTGKITETLWAPNPMCDQCTGADKGKPIKGMTVLNGLKKDGDEYNGGTVFKASTGKTYKGKAKLINDGKTLEVSGCVAFICKSQEWTREP